MNRTQKAHRCTLVLMQGQGVCVCVGTQVNKGKYAPTQLKATCKSKPTLLPWSRHKLPSVTDGSKDTGKHTDQGSKS